MRWRVELDLGRFLAMVELGDVERMARHCGFAPTTDEESDIRTSPGGPVIAVLLKKGESYLLLPRNREVVDAVYRLTQALSRIAESRGVSPTVVLWELLPDRERQELADYLIPRGARDGQEPGA